MPVQNIVEIILNIKDSTTKFMKGQLLLIIFFMMAPAGYGQKRKSSGPPPGMPTNEERKREAENHQCTKKDVISLIERLMKYPFNVASRIQLVSFDHGVYLLNGQMAATGSLLKINDSVIYSKLKETKTLTRFQVDQLTDLFYNYGYKGPVSVITEAGCYMPRNAILFLDPKGKILELIEICFECRKMYASSEKVSFGEMCDQKMEMLFGLFQKAGITYGITKGRIFGNEQ